MKTNHFFEDEDTGIAKSKDCMPEIHQRHFTSIDKTIK
jgi:hypothetical protein